MAVRANQATPNLALFNLRDARGESQQDVAEALNDRAAQPPHRRKGVCITANQVSRWERGITRPSPFYRQLLAEHYGATVEQLGLTRPKTAVPVARPASGDAFELVTPERPSDAVADTSQARWRSVRQALNGHRVALAQTVADLYEPSAHLPGTGLLVSPDWLPPEPVPLDRIELELDPRVPAPVIDGTGEATAHVRPMATAARSFHRYSQAIRAIDQPRLFENRIAWSLLDLSWCDGRGFFSFGETTYFDQVDVAEALAHESAAALVADGGEVLPPSWRGLSLRRQIGDPFDVTQRSIGASTDTLTIRQDRDGATFVLHNRNSGNVAVAGGMLHVMPCGIFQPSSILPAAQEADFDLWRNIMREYSEEFLGNPEHDGGGRPIDYEAEPFDVFQEGVRDGRIRPYCLGVGLDGLTLFGEVLTVVVFEAQTYDRLFADMVDHNEEGTVVKTGRVHPTSALPFTEHTIRELLDSTRLAPAGAGCLALAWQHRRAILG